MVFKNWKSTYRKITNATRSHKYNTVTDDEEPAEMSPRRQIPCHLLFLRQVRIVKFFFIVSCTSLVLSLFWVQLATKNDHPAVSDNLIQEALENVARDSRYKDVYRKTETLPKNFKYLLLWTRNDYAPFYYLGDGQRAFLKNNCSVIKCYVTTNKRFFGGDLTKFDAIAFNGRNLNPYDLPSVRSRHQKYIFFEMESADNYPVCAEQFEGFFNWTATYRLDSDIPYPYILVRDNKGEIIGPKRKMRWKEEVEVVNDDFADRIQNKTKAAAWLVSHCRTRSGREGYVRGFANALKAYGLTVDVYGQCGTLSCPEKGQGNCKSLLERDYFFYMALENAFTKDYVTEKVLTALQHGAVPIVYGGADYSRFLPPGSYIDGRKHHIYELAALVNRLIRSPKEYSRYFWWKNHYSFSDPSGVENVCSLCEALHDKKMLEKTTIYEDFRAWWNPYFESLCPRKLVIF